MFRLRGFIDRYGPEAILDLKRPQDLSEMKTTQVSKKPKAPDLLDMCKVRSPAPSVLLRSQYFILAHFSERGKYDSAYRLQHKCVA